MSDHDDPILQPVIHISVVWKLLRKSAENFNKNTDVVVLNSKCYSNK